MLLRAFAKVNLDLRVLHRRPDGYHEVRTVLQTVDWYDEIEITASDRFSFTVTAPGDRAQPAPPADESNLVVRAVREFERISGVQAPVRIELVKHIPAGAGLGGGSADAAVTLLGLQRVLGRRLSEAEQLQSLQSLGADVPFFAIGGRALGVGRGDRVHALEDRPGDDVYRVVIVVPGVFIGTREAYSWLTIRDKSNSIEGFCAEFVPDITDQDQTNDFEDAVFERFPLLAGIKQELLRLGALRASLSGSGSAVFGVFENDAEAARAASCFAAKFEVRVTRLLRRSEYLRRVFGS